MTPRPPAEETAAARGAVEVWAMPARRMGWGIWRRVVRGVVRRGGEGAIAVGRVGRDLAIGYGSVGDRYWVRREGGKS